MHVALFREQKSLFTHQICGAKHMGCVYCNVRKLKFFALGFAVGGVALVAVVLAKHAILG